jgi:hypothetical protein
MAVKKWRTGRNEKWPAPPRRETTRARQSKKLPRRDEGLLDADAGGAKDFRAAHRSARSGWGLFEAEGKPVRGVSLKDVLGIRCPASRPATCRLDYRADERGDYAQAGSGLSRGALTTGRFLLGRFGGCRRIHARFNRGEGFTEFSLGLHLYFVLAIVHLPTTRGE